MNVETYEETAERLRAGKKGQTKQQKKKERQRSTFTPKPCPTKKCFANCEGKCIALNQTYTAGKCPFYKPKGGEKVNVNKGTNFCRNSKGQCNTGKRYEPNT